MLEPHEQCKCLQTAKEFMIRKKTQKSSRASQHKHILCIMRMLASSPEQCSRLHISKVGLWHASCQYQTAQTLEQLYLPALKSHNKALQR